MRFIIQVDLASKDKRRGNFHIPGWVGEILPVQDKGSIDGLAWSTFKYITDDKSIVESNWDKPFFYNEEYFIFLAGHVFLRVSEADKRGKYVPSPKEVLEIILLQGDNHFKLLKGCYYIVLFNRITRKVTIYSSALALYPAWYFIENGGLIISDFLESLLRIKKNISLNPHGLLEFTLFDHCIGANTIYEGIFQLEGGHALTICEEKISDRLVYDIVQWKTDKPVTRKESLSAIRAVLERHISEFTGSVKQFNLSLTGGFDGRLNFSFIKKSDYNRLQAFSYGKKGSLQIDIPEMISKKLGFRYKEVLLEDEFLADYARLGMQSIIFTGGITPFIRAVYPFGYGKISSFSRNCILGQCDMIRPLYTNPAGAIFNTFSHDIFYNDDAKKFYDSCALLSGSGFLQEKVFSGDLIEKIFNDVRDKYILPYSGLDADERYYFFLMKESMMKFWQTECHLVDLFTNDFISFADLDYIEMLASSEYFGLYKGVFASSQFGRRKGQDLYADLMFINNNALNDIIVDRLYKPKWIRKGWPGYLMIMVGKLKANARTRKTGNDTFGGVLWSDLFYQEFKKEINRETSFFNSGNLRRNKPYRSENTYRYDRHISLKIWLQHLDLI